MGLDNYGHASPQQPAFDSTMDLHNNLAGALTIHTYQDFLNGELVTLPDFNAILADLLNKYKAGTMWIWDGGVDESSSQGILLTSNGTKIYR